MQAACRRARDKNPCRWYRRALGPHGVQKAEVRKILGTPAGTPAPYQVIATLYFSDAATLQSAIESADGQAVVADIPNFYGAMPDIMIGEIVE